jgi:glycosyltransferase involved in cell wall biosynthesis
MNVVVVTNLFPNIAEPMRSTFNEQQVLALRNMLGTVSVIVPIDWRRKLKLRRDGFRADQLAKPEWNGLPVSYPTFYYIPKLANWLNGPLMFLSILPQWLRARKQHPDAIFATWAFPDGFAAVLLGKLSGVRVVVKVHGSDVEILAKETLRRVLTVWALNRASAVVSVSAYLRDLLVDFGVRPSKLCVIYNGIDDQKFCLLNKLDCRRTLELSETKKIVLYIGNLKKDKGVIDLLNAFATMCGVDSKTELLFAGDGIAKAEIENLGRSLGISGSVRMLGRLTHDDLPQWINAADLLCLPSHHEGVPNVLLEAIACGTPCVATTVGGIPEVVTPDAGLLVAPGDVQGLARALTDSLATVWDRNKIKASLTAGSWAKNATQLVSVISDRERI